MKAKPAILFLLFFAFFLNSPGMGQGNKISFEQNKSWHDIVKKAKIENKYIFVDCYATWCMPCKYMDNEVFTNEEVIIFINRNFVSVKLQFDSTKNDSPEIKNQFSNVNYLRNQYSVKAYPTFLFFNSDGQIVHRDLGTGAPGEFIELCKKALDPKYQYYTQLNRYLTGDKDISFLNTLAILSMKAFDGEITAKVMKDFINTDPELNNSNVNLIFQTTQSVKDTGFSLIMSNIDKFELIIGNDDLKGKLKQLIINSEQENMIGIENWNNQEWNKLYNKLLVKYPQLAEEVIQEVKIQHYNAVENWFSFADIINQYLSRETISPNILNNYSWTIFTKCTDISLLSSALSWSKRTFENKPESEIDPGYMDTYANILYKMGKNKEAIEWEKKAQAIAIKQGASIDWGQDVIDKITKGEKTW